MNSQFFKWNLSDWWKGLILAAITVPIGIIYDTVNAGSLAFDYMTILKMAIVGILAYLSKNLLSNSEGKFAKTEPK